MRFMLIVKATPESEAGEMPKAELISAMTSFNEEMAKAGVLLTADGLHPSSKGARIKFSAGKTSVLEGPFSETKELIAGFWLIRVQSREEAIEWARRSPAPNGPDKESVIEVRQIFDIEEFPSDVLPPAEAEREKKLRDQLETKQH